MLRKIVKHRLEYMHNLSRTGSWVAVLLLSSRIASSNILVSTAGSFTADDDVVSFNFSLGAPDVVTMQTWSFAGGTNIVGSLLPPGGFAPVLSLFDATGAQNLIAFDAGGVAPSGCGVRNIDPSTGFCLDAYLNLSLGIGSYIVTLTQFDNLPNGPALPNGFFEAGNGNFTGGPFFLNAGAGFQRNGNWAVDISTPLVTVTPEPATAVLVFTVLAALALAHRIRRRWNRRAGI